MTVIAPPEPVLRAEGIHKRFGGVHALRGTSLVVHPGEVHTLVGENGSGKSTLLKILSGQLQPDSGTIEFAGEPTALRNATDALRRGIATVTQETTLVPDLSIAENVLLGHRKPRRAGLIDWSATRRSAREALARLSIDLQPTRIVRHLRPDQQQMVEIARALSVDARVLILDEPTSSLTDDEVDSLFRIVRRLTEQGVATIFVTHRLNEVFRISDRITVLRDGHTVGTGAAGEFDRPRLIELMVGRALEHVGDEAGRPQSSDALLRVRGLTLPGAFAKVDLEVAPGEVVGLAGLVGAGRSELLEALFGLRVAEGSVELAGQRVTIRNPRDAIRLHVGFVPADRKRQGLVLEMSVRENLMMASTARLPRVRYPNPAEELEQVTGVISDLQIRAHSTRAPVATLSGGNQQKVVLGKWLSTQPRLLLLDEPTRGVDVGAKAEIYKLLLDASRRDIGVVVSSSEIPELLTLCDRIVVLFRGHVAAVLSRAEATEARIAHYAGGQE